jgi:hypothetical protein
MKIVYNGIAKDPDIDLVDGKEYEIIAVEKEWYRIVDESGEDYLYPPQLFEIIKDN